MRAADLTGRRFGRLTAIRVAAMHPRRGAIWLCSCACGNTARVLRGNLIAGNTRSCGCLGRAPRHPDLKGKRFGRLVTSSVAGIDCRGARIWRCRCDCGTAVLVRAGSLLEGNTRSCGCRTRNRGDDLTGGSYGAWRVLRRAKKLPGGKPHARWICVCRCGKKRTVLAQNLIGGLTRSCGCQRKEKR